MERRGDWMQTYSGRQFWPLDPRADEIHLPDIAASLSKMCRYAGHTLDHYSVAEHSVLMMRHLRDHGHGLDVLRWALLHDASEAYLVDVPRPVKPFLPGYREHEAALMAVVAKRFGLSPEMPAAVHAADNCILADEKAQAMTPGLDWPGLGEPLGVKLRFWNWSVAWYHFEDACAELGIE